MEDNGDNPLYELDGADVTLKHAPQIQDYEDIENLVFRGGGVKGIAYCGALRVLTELDMLHKVKRFGGSSAGAITAALLALGYNIDELELIFRDQDINSFKDGGGNILARAERLFQNFALYEGKYFLDWISKLISGKADVNITFQQVFLQFGKELVITGTCLTHMDVHYFSPRTYPDMPIRDALRISMSIPIFFEPVKVDDHLFVDGGLGDNFPLCIFDSETLQHHDARHAEINMKTLGLFLQEDKTRQQVTRQIKQMKDFISCLLDTVKLRIAQLSLKPGDEKRILFIHTHFVSSTKFKISKEEKDLLYYEGQRSARAFFTHLLPSSGPLVDKTASRLIVQLKEGLDLKKKALSHVYCVLKLGRDMRETATKYGTSNPIWNENFIFSVENETDCLTLEVFEAVRTPRLLGASTFPVIYLENGQPALKWIDIGKGKILLQITHSA